MNNSSAFLYGKGVFTTIAIRGGEAFLWEKHWRRLADNARRVGIELSAHSEGRTRKTLIEEVKKSGVVNGKARITFYDETPAEMWSSDGAAGTGLSVIVGKQRPIPQPFKLTLSPHEVNSRSPLTGIKSCNYLENTLALEEAKTRGYHEAFRVNERGHVTSGCMSNVFWLKDNKLYTPALTTGCLAGTTREFVMENLEVLDAEAGIIEVRSADAIFLTSAGIGVVSASRIDDLSLAGKDHSITTILP